jgi:putative NIF3 family GTP cyclohydrolase 1 type 2
VAGANPYQGEVGALTSTQEIRLSMVLERSRRSAVVAAMRAAHPYEEVAFELTEQAPLAGDTGSGRIGRLAEPVSLGAFTELVAERLPRTATGVRAAGDPDQRISSVAVCGGSGSSFADAARAAGADAYLSADGKHHSTLEAVTERTRPGGIAPMAMVDAAHWATEWPWLDVVAGLLRDRFGDRLEVLVSSTVTDPWTLHAGG